jgi:2-polyprenyl-3-methyl-5-hydroxy-6-metoxy-1,4-benzoquinol methylase
MSEAQTTEAGQYWHDRTGDFVDYVKKLVPYGSIIDMGCGKGLHTRKLAENKKYDVTGVDRDPPEISKVDNLEFIYHDFSDNTERNFIKNASAIYCNHMLEHCKNPLDVLVNFWNNLNDKGLLFIAVPPHVEYISPGHISMGWSIGQLWYLLSLAGFDCSKGYFKKESHSIRAIVPKGPLDSKEYFKNYPKEKALYHNGIERLYAGIDSYRWEEL